MSYILVRRAHGCKLFALLLVFLAGCAAQPAASDVAQVDRLLALIDQRLGFMDDVARNKWNSGAPIEDLPREAEIIDSLGRQAAGFGIDAEIVRGFFRAQIEASKTIQRARFAEWRVRNQPPFKNPPDLRDTIRPALDALTPEMMKALAGALQVLRLTGGASLVNSRAAIMPGAGTSNAIARDQAIAPLVRVAR